MSEVLSILSAIAPPTPAIAAGRQVRAGLLGRGIGASLTPAMHRQEGARLGIDYEYVLIDFDALGFPDAALEAVVDGCRQLGFSGVNITFPFKQQVIALLDSMSDSADAIGAVNTVILAPDGAIGHNTDCWGFAESFRRNMAGTDLSGVLQLGAGGAGAAVAQALLDIGVAQLALFDVNSEKSEWLCKRLERRFPHRVSVASSAEEAARTATGIVNTTPVGMTKLPGVPLDIAALRPSQWVADIIYFPRETMLVESARRKGCRVLPGSGMAVFQAVRAFELFSGQTPDAEEMERTFQREA